MKILNSKKSTEVVSNWAFWMIFVVAIGFMVMIVVRTGNVSVAEASRIPPSLEDEVLLASRFYNLGECFAYVDEVGRVHSKIIDQEKFTKGTLDSCYAPSNANYAFRLTLEPLSVSSKEVPVPTNFDSTCNDICGIDGRACMIGIDDGGNIKKCDQSFGFEGNDDYCICGSNSENVIPVPDDYSLKCDTICSNKGKGCATGIDDGSNDKKCSTSVGFEGSDDYCICGNGFEEVVPVPASNFDSTCNTLCSNAGKGCVMGIDDSNKNRECSTSFGFEGNDDYCICGPNSEKVTPAPPAINQKCDTLCSDKGKVCMAGIDDGNDNKKCNDIFGFEGNDDYCICGSDSEKIIPVKDDVNNKCADICSPMTCINGVDDGNKNKECTATFGFEGNDDYCICGSNSENVIPVPDDLPSTTCNTICSNNVKECISGVNDGSGKQCTDAFTFNGNDDYCICREEITPPPFPSSAISTYNWISGKFENTRIEENVMVVFNDNNYEGKLTIKIQNVK